VSHVRLGGLALASLLFVLATSCGGPAQSATPIKAALVKLVPVEAPVDTTGFYLDGTTTTLPLGDGKISTSARAGYIWRCGQGGGGVGGAFRDGPWIDTVNKTYDPTQKVTVDGNVAWPSMLSITVADNIRHLRTNDLPNHGTGVFPIASSDDAFAYDRNPNSIRSQNIDLGLPAWPSIADAPSCLGLGAIGVTLTGVELFDGLDAPGRDAEAHEIQDICGGHPEVTGAYHYHAQPICFNVPDLADGHSGLTGYAIDGFGIYGPNGENGVPLSDGDLDECHGHTHVIEWEGQMVEMYHYHFTTEYPYSLGCFKGTPVRSRR
jgi:hypothetical protein